MNKDNYENLSEFLKGDPGTIVKLHIKRDGTDDQILVFNLVREEIEVKNLTYYGFLPGEQQQCLYKIKRFFQNGRRRS